MSLFNAIGVVLLLIITGLLVYIVPFLPRIKLWPAMLWRILFPGRRSSPKNIQHKKFGDALVSVIIPVYNEGAKALKDHLSSLTQAAIKASRVEIVVVDGGSQDDTMEAFQEKTDSRTWNKVSNQSSKTMRCTRSLFNSIHCARMCT